MRTNYIFVIIFILSFFITKAQNKAAYFSGFSKYYTCGNINISGDQLTVEALVKLDGSGLYMTGQSANDIVSKHNGANDANYVLRPDHCEITTENGHFYSKISLSSFSKDSFYHVAMTYNGVSMKFYVNECLFSDVPATGRLITNNYQTTIGQLASNPTALSIEQLYGYTDEIRIWSIARTQEQIRSNMHQLVNPTLQNGLLAYYNFEGNANNIQGNSIFNAVPYGNPEIKVQEGFNVVKTLSATYSVQQPACNTNNGTIKVSPSGGKAPYQYSIDGVNYQVSNSFTGLSNGTYNIYVKADGSGCIKDTTIQLTQPCQQNSCNTWLSVPSQPSYVRIGDLDVTGNKITVEALINRTAPWSGSDLFQGDIVSKHEDFKDCNYLLRPSSAEITTSNGYFRTPTICPIELNKTYHVAMVYDGSRLKFYRNGFLMSEIAATGNLFQNNWQTQIGLYFNQLTQENFIGYINEVRIWNVARSQTEINNFMSRSLTNPQTLPGLLAYYTFDNLINKQGNALWNGKIGGNASINKLNPNCDLKIDSCNIIRCTAPLVPDFNFTQDVCNPKAIQFVSSLTDMNQYEWDFGNNQTQTNVGSVTVNYADFGDYTVILKVKSKDGCEGMISKNVKVNIESDNIITTSDTTICKGDSVVLKSSNLGVDFCWRSTDMQVIGQTSSLKVQPLITTTYSLTAKTIKDNLIINGDFSGGNSGFQSDYSFSTSGIPEGVYNVGSNIQSWHNGLANCSDRTSGGGNMLMINGSATKNAKVWYQTITVEPNTNYVFSVWIASLSPTNPAHLQFSINGNLMGADFNANSQTCQWTKFFNTWNSGNKTTATIAIINLNQLAMGNDFALDDLFFGEVTMQQENVKITIAEKPVITLSDDALICEGTQVQLHANGAQQYKWSPSSTLSVDNIANPIAAPIKSTVYYLSAASSNGCTVKDSVKVIVKAKPVFGITPFNNSICLGDSLLLNATGGSNYKWISNESLTSDKEKAMVFPKATTTYKVHIEDSLCQIRDTLSTIIKVNQLPNITVSKSNDIDCKNTTTQLSVSGGDMYDWFPATGLSSTSVANPIGSPRESITYYVKASNRSGCFAEDSVKVLVTNSGIGEFYVPTAFTPDGNGKNDCFGVKYWGLMDDFMMVIYNRWGEVVFSTKDNNACWDGKFKGVAQGTGVFVYLIKAKSFCGNIEKKGVLTLLR